MLIVNKQAFTKGLTLLLSFCVIFVLILMPLIKGMNTLDYADDLFNKLSKASANYFDQVGKDTAKHHGKQVSFSVKVGKDGMTEEQVKTAAETAVQVFTTLGAQAEANGAEVKLTMDLGAVLGKLSDGSKLVYDNQGDQAKAFFGMEYKKALKSAWETLTPGIKKLQAEKKIEEANAISNVLKRCVETAYNYDGVKPESVMQHLPEMLGLLVFYVIYTMWYGYSIFYLFEGIGMSMKKAKDKKEV